MITNAIIDQGYMRPDYIYEYSGKIRKQVPCDKLLVITTGNFTRNAGFTPFDFNKRFEAMKAAGADIIIKHPVFSTCLRKPYFNFSLTSFINKLRFIDNLILPVADDSPESLAFAEKFTSDLIFSYSSVTCRQVTVDNGVFLQAAEAAAKVMLSQYIDSAGNVVTIPCTDSTNNGSSLPNADSTGCRTFLPVSDLMKKDNCFMSYVKNYFRNHDDKNEMLEIFGGTDTLIDYLLANRDMIESGHLLSESVNALSNELHTSEKIRQYLLRCIMNLRKLDHSIMALYEYSPYAHVIYEKADDILVTDLIREKGYIQQVLSYKNEDLYLDELNPSKQTLFNIDKVFCSIFE